MKRLMVFMLFLALLN